MASPFQKVQVFMKRMRIVVSYWHHHRMQSLIISKRIAWNSCVHGDVRLAVGTTTSVHFRRGFVYVCSVGFADDHACSCLTCNGRG